MYVCGRCNASFNFKHHLQQHYRRKNLCKAVISNNTYELLLEQLTQNEKQVRYACKYCSRIFSQSSNRSRHQHQCPSKPTDLRSQQAYTKVCDSINDADLKAEIQNLTLQIHKLKMQNLMLQKQKDEEFYQSALAMHFGHGHKTVRSGITDITTPHFHAEIKHWKKWKQAIGQLMVYNENDPRPELRIYLFGRDRNTNSKGQHEAIRAICNLNVIPYHIEVKDDKVIATNLIHNTEYVIDCNNSVCTTNLQTSVD